MATIEELLKKLKAEKATARDLQEYADLLGRDAGREVAKKILEDGLPEDEILALSLGLSRGNHGKISDYGDVVTAAGYEAEGIHLKPVRPDFSKTDVRDALREISEKENATDDFIKSRIALVSQKVADRYMQANAEAANRAGLTALVSREYVSGSSGAHTTSKHPKVCAWCESRSTHGKMIPYPEAYAKGVFERHPNCKCIIDYISKRGEMTTQSRAGKWQKVEGAQALKMRQRYGVDKKQFNPLRTVKNSDNIIQKGVPLKLDLQFFAEKGLKRQSDNDLRQGIRSLKERIREHEGYLKDPASHDAEWNSHTEKHRQGLWRHWKKEISNYEESIRNRREELRRRGAKDE